MNLKKWPAKLLRSVKTRGLSGTARLCGSFAAKRIHYLGEATFDLRHRVDTGGIVTRKALSTLMPCTGDTPGYRGVRPDVLMRCLEQLPLHTRDFSFVDCGSGKGRAMLIASMFPFKRLFGVEYCAEFNSIARQNWRKFRPRSHRLCPDAEFITGDAGTFAFPSEPFVLFLYNPFGPTVMTQILTNLRGSLAMQPRRMYCVYVRPDQSDMLSNSNFLRVFRSHKDDVDPRASYVIYEGGE